MAMPQPKTIEEMVDLASEYAQNNKGVRHLAILLPFNALGSYNDAERQYHGIRHSLRWQDSVRDLLTDLNFEYVRLQRLQFVLSDRTQIDRISDDVFSDAKQKARHSHGQITMPTVALQAFLTVLACDVTAALMCCSVKIASQVIAGGTCVQPVFEADRSAL